MEHVKLAGTPVEIGRQHGKQLRSSLHQIAQLVNDLVVPKREKMSLDQLFERPKFQSVLNGLLSETIDEAAAVANAAGIPISVPLYITVMDDWGMLNGRNEMACSSVVLERWVGRTLDYFRFMAEQMAQLRTVFRIERQHVLPILSDGWPGYLGCLTGTNGKLFAAIHANQPYETYLLGKPSGVIVRAVLEHASNLKEAIDLLRSFQSMAVYHVLIADQATSATVTISPSGHHIIRQRSQEPLVTTNHPPFSAGVRKQIRRCAWHCPTCFVFTSCFFLSSCLRKKMLEFRAKRVNDDFEGAIRLLRHWLVAFNNRYAASVSAVVYDRLTSDFYVSNSGSLPVTGGDFVKFSL